MTRDRAYKLRSVVVGAVAKEDDDIAFANPNLLPEWMEGKQYIAGRKLVHDGVVYKVLIDHTSQSDWSPDISPSLFARVLNPNPEEIPEWEQPDSTNAYMIGDQVRYKGRIYESVMDYNIWSPEAYPAGWKIIE